MPIDGYVVVVRAISAAHLPYDDPLVVNLSEGRCVVETEQVDGEHGWPISLRGTAWGDAADLDDAQRRLAEHVSGLLPVVALAANAAHQDPRLVMAHGTRVSAGAPADWIGYEWPTPTSYFPPHARRVTSHLVGELLQAADRYPSDGYHGRAVGLYREALTYWTPESRLLAAEYLWMATEALGRGIVEADAAKAGITPKNLAQLRKVGSPELLYRDAREQIIFNGDLAALQTLEEASDGFEHGYMPIPDVRARIEPILESVAGYLRHALIGVLDLPEPIQVALLDAEFEEPRGIVPPMKILRGVLALKDPDPAAAAVEIETPVEMHWDSPAERRVERDPDGTLQIVGTTRATVRELPDGVRLTVDTSRARAQGATAYRVSEPIVRRAASAGSG